MQRTPRLRLGFNAWHPSGVLDVLNSAGGLRCAPTSGYSLAGFQPARPGLREGYKNAAVAQPPACGVQPTRGSEIMAASQSAACGVAQPGGLEESSRGLSAAIPPDTGAKLVCTPEGCQLNGTTASIGVSSRPRSATALLSDLCPWLLLPKVLGTSRRLSPRRVRDRDLCTPHKSSVYLSPNASAGSKPSTLNLQLSTQVGGGSESCETRRTNGDCFVSRI